MVVRGGFMKKEKQKSQVESSIGNNQNGNTILHKAAKEGELELVQLLLEISNIDPNQKNKYNETPYNYIYEYSHDSEKIRKKNNAVKQLLKSYMIKNRSISKDTPTSIQQDEQLQDTYANDGVNPDHLFPFAGTSEEFSKLLSTGTYESFENRVFLCGSCACGKSTLASVLIGSPIPLTWISTDGLVIHFGRNESNCFVENRGQNVLTKVIIGKPTRETSTCQSSDTHLDQHMASSSIGTDRELNFKARRNEASYSSKASQLSDACLTKSQDLPSTNTVRPKIKNTPSISLPKMKKIEAYTVHDDILKEVKSGQYQIKIAPSDLVDFGGQRSYDMTHQLFVQHGGTFVIMFDGSRDFNEPLKEYPMGDISSESIVRHWVNSILTYCVDDGDVMPMILFAATHSDLLQKDLQEKMKIEFVKKVTDMFGTHERKKHFVFDPVFFINGTDKNDQEIQNLKTTCQYCPETAILGTTTAYDLGSSRAFDL
ncbi:unnamed protein product [Mytilus edulis]|uniref:Uncharacterized protein n=1 Tax=Mytilus edulis TaxID=6550 RepID=A0A8S3U7K0_MYTED|nr:unnamed protein product [Mytilus edulis]